MSLKITTIQSELHWEDVDQNLEMFSQKIAAIKEPTDIIVLPEMFNTGFSMQSGKLAEEMGGKSGTWLKEQAREANAVIVASLIIKENENYYNRLVWAQPDGVCQTYDKRHLFRMAEEHHHFTAGKERLIINYKGWRICPLVCYDLRFPVWSRNSSFKTTSSESVYDCLIYIANWPEARRDPWNKLLQARAIENQAYVIGVNRVGVDGKGISYSGDSSAIDPKGNVLSSTKPSINQIETVELSMTELTEFREKFPVSMDADLFSID